jgi:hypothetical protein
MIESGEAPFKCRSGSRYLYVDEFGSVHWCYQARKAFSKDLLAYTYADLREQFDTPKNCNTHCTIGCARTASATDEWRSQPGLSGAPVRRLHYKSFQKTPQRRRPDRALIDLRSA